MCIRDSHDTPLSSGASEDMVSISKTRLRELELGQEQLDRERAMIASEREQLDQEKLRFERHIQEQQQEQEPVSYTHLRAHETPEHLVCRLLLEKKKHSYPLLM
eukprot:TRINITY_DN11289_c0_g1_i1.p2 TRINITY_DN11289_c0_g1~~TRINITY_DN11289_c0_g1_i1.p2  ORF type:complete len:104 (-),score=44.37 TRINITY_DN11289_c0_g1_i1:54-365(-)